MHVCHMLNLPEDIWLTIVNPIADNQVSSNMSELVSILTNSNANN